MFFNPGGQIRCMFSALMSSFSRYKLYKLFKCTLRIKYLERLQCHQNVTNTKYKAFLTKDLVIVREQYFLLFITFGFP